MNRLLSLACLFPLFFFNSAFADDVDRPNVLFVAVDDLNDWVGYLGGHPQAATPNIDRLAARGVAFTRAYCSSPLCNPSRVSLLTGIEPSKSGVFGNRELLRDHLPHAVTLMQCLRSHGYVTKGAGKIFHGANSPGDAGSWDDYHRVQRDGAKPKRVAQLPKSAWAPWGPLDIEEDKMFDTQVVNWTIAELNRHHQKPFFLACGFTKPHLPWYVPRKYFDLHPLDSIVLPETLENDRDDLPFWGKKFAAEVHDVSDAHNYAGNREDHAMVLKHDQWQRGVQSYLATISFVDAQLGRLLDGLQKSQYADNTIVILWGDHGWHLGEKQHWRKHALWEDTTRTPFIIAGGNGQAEGVVCSRPVSLLSIYPTVLELLGLPQREELDGHSLVPLLDDPNRSWDHPVLMTYGNGNHAIRTERWRYIRYADGGEELYDHRVDPNEWTNLATLAEYKSIIDELKNQFSSNRGK